MYNIILLAIHFFDKNKMIFKLIECIKYKHC